MIILFSATGWTPALYVASHARWLTDQHSIRSAGGVMMVTAGCVMMMARTH